MSKKYAYAGFGFVFLVVIAMATLLYYKLDTIQNGVLSMILGNKEATESKTSYISVFSWEEDMFSIEKRTKVYSIMEKKDISDIYQKISDEQLYSQQMQSFLQQANNLNINVHYLAGDAKWALDKTAKSMIEKIDHVLLFNQANSMNSQFSGIIFDIEPYLTDAWEENESEMMQTFVEAMIAGYEYAHTKNLRITICIPYWFDNSYINELESLIAKACDEVAVMNYHRKNETKNMENEVMLSEKYDKPIICIFELQKPGTHGLTDMNTYYNDGIEAAKESFDKLEQNFNYSRLGFSYHDYSSIEKLMVE